MDGRTVEERVRGVLITPAGTLLLIKRIRGGTPPYWVFPGGGVEADDADREAALLREVREEVGGTATIRSLVLILERETAPASAVRELFYLADIPSWDERARNGPELARPDAGEYVIDEFPLDADEIASRDIKPEVMKRWLLDHHAGLVRPRPAPAERHLHTGSDDQRSQR
jgi:8-oxo-dGTP pyrophosphatase MutT (NUDIX family)